MKIRSFFNGQRVPYNDRLCSPSVRSVLATLETVARTDGWGCDIAGTRDELLELGAYPHMGGAWTLRTDEYEYECSLLTE